MSLLPRTPKRRSSQNYPSETVWKIGSGSESGLRGPPGGVKEPRSAASCHQRSTVAKPSAIFQTVSLGHTVNKRSEHLVIAMAFGRGLWLLGVASQRVGDGFE